MKPKIINLLVGLLLCTCGLASGSDSRTPNILLIMADDLGYNDVAIFNNNADIHTPAIDQLAREGIRYTRHYAFSTCSPSRAALLTGLHPSRLNFTAGGRGISPDIITLPERLVAAGYSTTHIGKWHAGTTITAAHPPAQGFQQWFGFLNQWRLRGVQKNGEITPGHPTYINPWLRTESAAESRFEGHLTDILTDSAIKTIAQAKDSQPWFINLWYYSPHTPVTPAERFARLYPDTAAGRYRALVHQLDSNIQRLRSALEERQQLDNTIILFVSDNGGTNRAIDNNAPYYGRKGELHEGALRTPLIIRWPARIPANTVSNESNTIYDLYPTLLSLLELEPEPDVDGVDISATLSRGAPPPEHYFGNRKYLANMRSRSYPPTASFE